MAELRWILLGLGLLSIGAIWWWSARRSGQAAGDAELREPNAAAAAQASVAQAQSAAAFGANASGAAASGEALRSERGADPIGAREWGIPPLEPLHIRTGEFEQIPELDEPMSALAEPPEVIAGLDEAPMEPSVRPEVPSIAAPSIAAPSTAAPAAHAGETRTLFEEQERPAPRPRPSREHSDRHSVEAPQAANSSQMQKIVTLRVCAVGEVRWAGSTLMQALESHGLAFGRYQVYHRKHGDGRSIFCVASLVEPGTFDTSHAWPRTSFAASPCSPCCRGRSSRSMRSMR